MPDDFSPELGDLAASQMTHWTPQQAPPPDYRNQAFQAAGGDPYRYAVQSVQDPNNPDRRIAEQFGMQGSIMGAQGATLEELVNLARAQRSLNAGLDPQSAMELYGWGNWPGVNRMVSEFSDQPAGWNPETEARIRGSQFLPGAKITDQLQNFISHPEMFARYPEFENLPTMYHRAASAEQYRDIPYGTFGRGAAAGIDPFSGRPIFNPNSPYGMYVSRYDPKWETQAGRDLAKSMSAGKPMEISAFLHELQHGIQRKENLPPGSTGTGPSYQKSAGEAQARASQKRAGLRPAELRGGKHGSIIDAIGREVPFQDQIINRDQLRSFPHDAPGWPGPAFDLQTPGGQRQMMADYAKRTLGRDFRPMRMPGDWLDRLKSSMGQ